MKWCDTMELVMWSMEERAMGNTHVDKCILNGMTWLWEAPRPNAAAQELMELLQRRGVALGVAMPQRPFNADFNIEKTLS